MNTEASSVLTSTANSNPNTGQRTSQIQRNRILTQAQKLESFGTSQLPSQKVPQKGIQNIFADPNYGIGLVAANTGVPSGGATVGSRHLKSPRKDQELNKLMLIGGQATEE